MEQKVFSVMSEEFTKNYDFYKDYDDMVIHKETEQIFKTQLQIFRSIYFQPLHNWSVI